MKQDISNRGARLPSAWHPKMSQGSSDEVADTRNALLRHDECAVPSTPRTRQNGFKDDLQTEGAKRIFDARLHIEGNFDAFGPDPAVAYAFFAQNIGAAGLAGLTPLRLRMSPENSV